MALQQGRLDRYSSPRKFVHTLGSYYNLERASVKPVKQTEHEPELEWTPEALAKLNNVPFFARAQAKSRSEELARQQWADAVTVDLIEQARVEFGQ